MYLSYLESVWPTPSPHQDLLFSLVRKDQRSLKSSGQFCPTTRTMPSELSTSLVNWGFPLRFVAAPVILSCGGALGLVCSALLSSVLSCGSGPLEFLVLSAQSPQLRESTRIYLHPTCLHYAVETPCRRYVRTVVGLTFSLGSLMPGIWKLLFHLFFVDF